MTRKIKDAYYKGMLAGAVLTALFMFLSFNAKVAEVEKENRLVHEYVACLQDNFVQRSYCASTVGYSYEYLDSLVTEYGYEYTQVGYDLYIDWKGGEE